MHSHPNNFCWLDIPDESAVILTAKSQSFWLLQFFEKGNIIGGKQRQYTNYHISCLVHEISTPWHHVCAIFCGFRKPDKFYCIAEVHQETTAGLVI